MSETALNPLPPNSVKALILLFSFNYIIFQIMIIEKELTSAKLREKINYRYHLLITLNTTFLNFKSTDKILFF
jgi:hypothetical protein